MNRSGMISALGLLILAAPAVEAAPRFETQAAVAYLTDLSSGAVLFDRNGSRRIPPASMAKMMTTHVAFSMLREGKLRLDRMCQVRPETWQQWHGPAAGSTMFLSPGEQVSVRNLLHGIVTLSGNDASVVLAECIAQTEPAFAALMNQEARRLGMRDSHFGNSNGWPDGGVTHTSARDLAILAKATIEATPDLYREFYTQQSFTWGKTMGNGQAIVQGNRNPLLGRVLGADGLKTGHTEEAGYGFTGSAIQNGRRLIMVVAGLDSFNQRIGESVRFMNWGFQAWRSRPLFKAGSKLGEARVQLGDAGSVAIAAPRDLAVTLPATVAGALRLRVVYDGPVKAPIRIGQTIAHLVVSAEGTPEQRLPLVAADEVGEAGFLRRAWAGFLALFS